MRIKKIPGLFKMYRNRSLLIPSEVWNRFRWDEDTALEVSYDESQKKLTYREVLDEKAQDR